MQRHDDDEPRGPRHALRRTRRDHTPTLIDVAPPLALSAQVTQSERAWIAEHLGPFRDGCLIQDVLRRIKAGKEATVYACSAHDATGALIAAKLYRARSLRGASNQGRYDQGRSVLDAEGRVVSARAWRLHKALAQNSNKGQDLAQTSWLMHEFRLLRELHARGANVPAPIAHNGFALLMEFIGDGPNPAPALSDVTLAPPEAKRLFEQLAVDIERLLELGWVHGDLSPHNLLYQRGHAVMIDFPQAVARDTNPEAQGLLERDLERIAAYFGRCGVDIDHRQLASELWAKHAGHVPRAGQGFDEPSP